MHPTPLTVGDWRRQTGPVKTLLIDIISQWSPRQRHQARSDWSRLLRYLQRRARQARGQKRACAHAGAAVVTRAIDLLDLAA